MAALAHYNLGLVALRRGDASSAVAWFARAQRETTDDRLRALTSERLASLPPPAERSWAAYAYGGLGYDDNVALISDGNVLGVSGVDDAFGEVQFAVSALLDQPWGFDGNVFLIDYSDLDEFDQIGAQTGARYRFTAGAWTNEAALQLAYATLDGESFENRRVLALQTTRELSTHSRLRLRYRFSDIDGMNDFDGVSGERHEASAQMRWSAGSWTLRGEYEFESSEHDDAALSATRHQFAFDAQHELSQLWTVAIEAAFRRSRYDEQAQGDENRTGFSLALTRRLTTRWRVVLRYDRADNDADVDEYNYERNRFTAALEAIL